MSLPPRLEKQYFFDEEIVDVIVNVVTELTTELGVVKERLDTVERVLDTHGAVTRDLIEQFEPDRAATLERAQARMQLVQTIMDPLREHFAKSSNRQSPKG